MTQCKLCRKEKKLIEAHVIPEAFYELHKNKHFPLIELNSSNNRIKRNRKGFYDPNILCEECDGELGILDQHAAETLLKSSKILKFRKGDLDLYQYNDAVAEKIMKYVASVVWRASISTLPFFKPVKIDKYEDKLRDYILGANLAFLENSILISEFDYVDAPIMNPFRSRFDGVNFVVLQANRFQFFVKLDQRQLPAGVFTASLQSGQPVHTIVTDWENSRNFKDSINLVKKSKRRDLPIK